MLGTLHIVTLDKNEAARDGAKAVAIDAVHNVHSTGGIKLQQGGSYRLNIFLLFQHSGDFDGHGGAAEAQKNGSSGRLNHDVRADAFNALGGFGEQAGSEADDEHHEGDFDGHSHYAYEGAHGAVEKVAGNELTHHCFAPCGFAPWGLAP